jgi:hypothetical protein
LEKNRLYDTKNDFERGYCYARLRCGSLFGKGSDIELRELAEVFARMTGENSELARGMSACYSEMARVTKGR